MGILTQADFDARIDAAREIVKRNRLDAIMVFSTECEPAQVRYFADYWPSFETAAVLIPAKGEPALLIGPESLTYASARTKIPNVIQLMDFRESSQPDYPGSKLPKIEVVRRDVVPRSVADPETLIYEKLSDSLQMLGKVETMVLAILRRRGDASRRIRTNILKV